MIQEKKTSVLAFDDYLRQLPSSWVFEHFLKKSTTGRRILSSSAIQDRSRQFARPDALCRQFAALAPELRMQCSLAYLMGAAGCDAPQDRAGLTDPLVQSFLVYAAKNAQGKTRYFGFDEFEPALRRSFAETIAAARVKAKSPGAAVSEEFFVNDFAMVLALASQGALVKKRQGGLVRNALLKIAKLTHSATSDREAGRLAALLVSFGLDNGLLVEDEERYGCNGTAAERWLFAPPAEQGAGLADFACTFAGSWRLDLLRETLNHAETAWLSSSVFPAADRQAAADTLSVLRWAGLVETGRAGSDTLFRAAAPRPAGATEQRPAATCPGMVALPDFSVVMPQEAPPACLFRFAKLGVFHSLDRVYKGSLDRGVLYDSLAGGIDGGAMIAWLEEWHAPSNVLATMREWVREFNRLYIAESGLLVAADEKVAFQVGAYEPLAGLLSPVPAYAVFRIKHGCEEQVKQIVAGMGFDHRMPDPDRGVAGGPDEAPGAEEGETWVPVVKTEDEPSVKAVTMRGKKYGAGLKKLDLNETIHIIDYATLTGAALEFEYEGSPLLKKGAYLVTPLSCSRGNEPMLEAAADGGRKKHFYIRKISAIGVGKA